MAAASFVIATRNRVSTLRDLLTSIPRQTVPVDALVTDDGASDALQGMLRSDVPGVRYYRMGTVRGLAKVDRMPAPFLEMESIVVQGRKPAR